MDNKQVSILKFTQESNSQSVYFTVTNLIFWFAPMGMLMKLIIHCLHRGKMGQNGQEPVKQPAGGGGLADAEGESAAAVLQQGWILTLR